MKMINAFVLIIVSLYLYSCSNTTTTPVTDPNAKTISGTVNYDGLGAITSGGYYKCAIYTTWPGSPLANDSLTLVRQLNNYTAVYSFTGLNDGDYFITSEWIKIPVTPGSVYGLGMYNCDSTSSCLPTKVTITGGQGRINMDFPSRIDTANHIYRH